MKVTRLAALVALALTVPALAAPSFRSSGFSRSYSAPSFSRPSYSMSRPTVTFSRPSTPAPTVRPTFRPTPTPRPVIRPAYSAPTHTTTYMHDSYPSWLPLYLMANASHRSRDEDPLDLCRQIREPMKRLACYDNRGRW